MINNILEKYQIKPYKYKYINKACIIYTKDSKFVIKKHIKDKSKIYDYLLSRNFNNISLPLNDNNDEIEIYDYLEDKTIDKDNKAKDLILVVAELHNKTTSYKKMNLDKIKEIYEDKLNTIDYLEKYYNSLEESFMLNVYNSPEEYLLQRNMDKIYNTLNYSRYLLEKWYKKIVNNPNIRISLIHNHLSLDHFIDNKLINFDHAKEDIPLYDLVNFYKNSYNDIDMESLFNIYKHKSNLTYEEELLLFIELIIPYKVDLSNSHFINTTNVYKLNKYLDKTRELILKQEEKYKKGNNTEKNK